MPRRSETSDRSSRILLTGATGFLGSHILRGILPRLPPDGVVYCLVRAGSAAEASQRLDALLNGGTQAVSPALRARCRPVWGDVAHEALCFEPERAAELLDEVDRVVHCAAAVKFNLPLDVARRANVTGTRNVLRLAERLAHQGKLRRVDYIGTAYVAGDTRGRVFEEELPDAAAFHNTYERTKWEAERVVRRYQGHLPIAIFRPSIVVGDSKTGDTASFRMLYWPLKLLASGTVPFAPVDPDGILDVVPVDFVIDAFNALTATDRSLGRCYHLAAGPAGQSSLGELLAMAAEFFGVRVPATIPPRLAFGITSPFLYAALWGKRRELLDKATSYLPYFAYRASFDTTVARAELDALGIHPPIAETYFRAILQFAVDTDWGRKTTAKSPRPKRARPAPPWRRFAPLLRVVTDRVDPNDPKSRDPELIRLVAPWFDFVGRWYFRAESEGLEHVPVNRPYLLVGNHSGGPVLPDVWMLLAYTATTFGAEQPAFAMIHDFAFYIPVLKNFLAKIGGLRASPENLAKALALGAGVLVYPGGDRDCFRSFWKRNTIDFYGRTGFVAMAYRHGVPIVPLVNIGAHEVYFTVFSSPRLARWTGIAKLTGTKTVPLIIGLPWGMWLGEFVPYIPLPSKFVYKVGPPIHLEDAPHLAEDRASLQRVYGQVTRVMQDMLDDLARRRRFPVLG